jgi:hypothetical protein
MVLLLLEEIQIRAITLQLRPSSQERRPLNRIITVMTSASSSDAEIVGKTARQCDG